MCAFSRVYFRICEINLRTAATVVLILLWLARRTDPNILSIITVVSQEQIPHVSRVIASASIVLEIRSKPRNINS